MMLRILFVACVFFFEAEDGIRDYKVTGVQTCALPILRAWFGVVGGPATPPLDELELSKNAEPCPHRLRVKRRVVGAAGKDRSEERRVGEEGGPHEARRESRRQEGAAGGHMRLDEREHG